MRKTRDAQATLSTIASEAGVSIATVSRVANGQLNRANPKTVEKIQALLEARNYRPNNIGRSLRSRQSRIVAMLAPNLDNPAMGAIATSTEVALREAGYVMILCDTHDQAALQDEYLHAMRAQSVEGYVIVSAVRSPTLTKFLERAEPIVLVGRRQTSVKRPVPFVGIDNRAAGALAADFLLDSGVRAPAVIHASLSSSAVADRVEGFIERLLARGLPRNEIPKADSDHLQHLFAGYEAMKKLSAETGRPRGLFCVSDLMAYGAYRFARESGVRVPDDCLIVGVDDNSLNDWIAPWLSSVHIPYQDYGAAVVDQLQAIWSDENASDRLLQHQLVVRSPDLAK
ncbi:LacI family DNA-binding transcriptional regulator [Terrarubrum flagellatum]|uniref:LacI family DNA-binding transcriptional regulator n=1 Tax=Terrirubrum flagellatum TaxID=2895980 RepID=UPI0031455A46